MDWKRRFSALSNWVCHCMCKDQGYLWINAVSPISMSSWSFLEGTHDRSLLSYPWRNPCVIGFLAQKIGDPFTHVPNRDEPINPSRIKNNTSGMTIYVLKRKLIEERHQNSCMYILYVTIIDLQPWKSHPFFLVCLEMGYTPISSYFHGEYAISAAPLLRPAAHRRPRRWDRWGNEDFAIEKWWKCPIYSWIMLNL